MISIDVFDIAIVVSIPLVAVFAIRGAARKSGWHHLAEAYPSAPRKVRDGFSFESAVIGRVGYSSNLRVGLMDDGLYLAAMWPFSYSHAPVLVPWSSVECYWVQKVLVRKARIVIECTEDTVELEVSEEVGQRVRDSIRRKRRE